MGSSGLCTHYDIYLRDSRICGVTSGSWNQSTETPKVICVMSIVRIRNGGIEQYSNLLKPVHTRAESLDRQRPESLMPLAPASVRHIHGMEVDSSTTAGFQVRPDTGKRRNLSPTGMFIFVCTHMYTNM